jgi:hypothetical protein
VLSNLRINVMAAEGEFDQYASASRARRSSSSARRSAPRRSTWRPLASSCASSAPSPCEAARRGCRRSVRQVPASSPVRRRSSCRGPASRRRALR